MRRVLVVLWVVLALGCAAAIAGEKGVKGDKGEKTDLAKTLEELDAKIKKTPDDPMLLYRKAQCLMELRRYDQGYEAAKQAMERFIAKKSTLAWMLLEHIDLGTLRVDVHFNMGPRERKPPDIGIVRPLSFRVWKKGEDAKGPGQLLEILDFEIGMTGGQPSTAALGMTMRGGGHANFGILDTDAKYVDIRTKALELIKKRHPSPQPP